MSVEPSPEIDDGWAVCRVVNADGSLGDPVEVLERAGRGAAYHAELAADHFDDIAARAGSRFEEFDGSARLIEVRFPNCPTWRFLVSCEVRRHYAAEPAEAEEESPR